MLSKFRDEVAGMLDSRKWPLEWVEQRIADGSIMLFDNERAVIGVEKRVYPGGLVELHGLFAAGELGGILPLVEEACAAARIAGCDIASISSTPGWLRVLKGRGFRLVQQTIEKDLTDGA